MYPFGDLGITSFAPVFATGAAATLTRPKRRRRAAAAAPIYTPEPSPEPTPEPGYKEGGFEPTREPGKFPWLLALAGVGLFMVMKKQRKGRRR